MRDSSFREDLSMACFLKGILISGMPVKESSVRITQ